MQIKLNGKRHEIPPLSKLTFGQFHKIMILQNVTDLPSYISFFTRMPVEEIMTAELSGASLPAIHTAIFNIDIKKTIDDKKEIIKYDGELIEVNDLSISTFGKSYILDMIRGRMGEKNFDMYEYCLYAVAVALSKEASVDEAQTIFKALRSMQWIDIVPQGFFLVKKYNRRSIRSKLESMRFMMELKKRNILIRISNRNLVRLEKI